ncbi:twin-arginine translocase subunit TatC [Candidatus Desantisbacteria bacterium]|nr:twin-arginine translocase subunit TatC [Candidatus Desantisbacteria bacterium]
MEFLEYQNNLETLFGLLNYYKKKILIFIGIFFIITIVFYFFSDYLLEFICSPIFIDTNPGYYVMSSIGEVKTGLKLIYTTPFEILFVKLKISTILSLIVLWPVFIFFIFKEINFFKKIQYVNLIIFIAGVLFFIGIYISSFIIFPLLIKFLMKYQNDNLFAFWTISNYISLLVNISIVTGILFEFPLALTILVKTGLVGIKKIIDANRYIIVFIFIFAAIITPTTDAVSMLLVAIPLCVVFELNVLILYILSGKEKNNKI